MQMMNHETAIEAVFVWEKRRTGTLCLWTPKAWGEAPRIERRRREEFQFS